MHCSKGRVRPVIGAVMARDAVVSRSIAPLGLPMMSLLKFRDARGLYCTVVSSGLPDFVQDHSLGASLASASAANRSYELAMSSIVFLAKGSSN
jgi:hypothetical protein